MNEEMFAGTFHRPRVAHQDGNCRHERVQRATSTLSKGYTKALARGQDADATAAYLTALCGVGGLDALARSASGTVRVRVAAFYVLLATEVRLCCYRVIIPCPGGI